MKSRRSTELAESISHLPFLIGELLKLPGFLPRHPVFSCIISKRLFASDR